MVLLVAGITFLPKGIWAAVLGILLIVAAVAWKYAAAAVISKRQQ
jgi:hypothetical protein